ncbi:hypothetical protein ACJIZ3_015122 [Penstemon smallii]|uniref:Uncharacterized protein n=1 Tax=Penstemon smallii TaxID=265156 RepID=A0ABD3RMC6_9LAMI
MSISLAQSSTNKLISIIDIILLESLILRKTFCSTLDKIGVNITAEAPLLSLTLYPTPSNSNGGATKFMHYNFWVRRRFLIVLQDCCL